MDGVWFSDKGNGLAQHNRAINHEMDLGGGLHKHNGSSTSPFIKPILLKLLFWFLF